MNTNVSNQFRSPHHGNVSRRYRKPMNTNVSNQFRSPHNRNVSKEVTYNALLIYNKENEERLY